MIGGLIDLYEAGFDRRRLAAADRLARRMAADFWDERQPGFYYTSAAHGRLPVRTKPIYDGAVPSGNASAALALLRLSKLLDNSDYFDKAGRLLSALAGDMRARPRAHLRLLCAADYYLSPTWEIAVVGRRDGADTRRLLEVVRRKFIPNKILALYDPDADSGPTLAAIPLLTNKGMIDGKAAAYVCRNFSCRAPVTDADALEGVLAGGPPPE